MSIIADALFISMGEVKTALGPPDETDGIRAENDVYRRLIYRVAAEGQFAMKFTHRTTEDKDTAGFVGAFDARLVEDVELGFLY